MEHEFCDVHWLFAILTKAFYWSDIRRFTGVKKKNFPQISLYLEQFTDKDTADRIREVVDGAGQ